MGESTIRRKVPSSRTFWCLLVEACISPLVRLSHYQKWRAPLGWCEVCGVWRTKTKTHAHTHTLIKKCWIDMQKWFIIIHWHMHRTTTNFIQSISIIMSPILYTCTYIQIFQQYLISQYACKYMLKHLCIYICICYICAHIILRYIDVPIKFQWTVHTHTPMHTIV